MLQVQNCLENHDVRKKLLYLPIDLPIMIDRDEIYDNFNPHGDYHVWKFMRLTEPINGKYGRNYFKENSRINFPTLCNYIDLLPFEALSNVKINFQTQEAEPHIDFTEPEKGKDLWENSLNNEPCGYRIVIIGSPDVMNIHRGEEIITTHLPEDTHTYVIDQGSARHSVVDDPGRITVFATGFINEKKHNDLLTASLNKYSQYAIWSE